MSKAVKFILQELDNNPEDRERFNSLAKPLGFYATAQGVYGLNGHLIRNWAKQKPAFLVHFIRTALSRVDGKAVLGALEGKTKFEAPKINGKEVLALHFHDNDFDVEFEDDEDIAFAHGKHYIQLTPPFLSDLLYDYFDVFLRNGLGWGKALEALDQYFVEEGDIVKLNVK